MPTYPIHAGSYKTTTSPFNTTEPQTQASLQTISPPMPSMILNRDHLPDSRPSTTLTKISIGTPSESSIYSSPSTRRKQPSLIVDTVPHHPMPVGIWNPPITPKIKTDLILLAHEKPSGNAQTSRDFMQTYAVTLSYSTPLSVLQALDYLLPFTQKRDSERIFTFIWEPHNFSEFINLCESHSPKLLTQSILWQTVIAPHLTCDSHNIFANILQLPSIRNMLKTMQHDVYCPPSSITQQEYTVLCPLWPQSQPVHPRRQNHIETILLVAAYGAQALRAKDYPVALDSWLHIMKLNKDFRAVILRSIDKDTMENNVFVQTLLTFTEEIDQEIAKFEFAMIHTLHDAVQSIVIHEKYDLHDQDKNVIKLLCRINKNSKIPFIQMSETSISVYTNTMLIFSYGTTTKHEIINTIINQLGSALYKNIENLILLKQKARNIGRFPDDRITELVLAVFTDSFSYTNTSAFDYATTLCDGLALEKNRTKQTKTPWDLLKSCQDKIKKHESQWLAELVEVFPHPTLAASSSHHSPESVLQTLQQQVLEYRTNIFDGLSVFLTSLPQCKDKNQAQSLIDSLLYSSTAQPAHPVTPKHTKDVDDRAFLNEDYGLAAGQTFKDMLAVLEKTCTNIEQLFKEPKQIIQSFYHLYRMYHWPFVEKKCLAAYISMHVLAQQVYADATTMRNLQSLVLKVNEKKKYVVVQFFQYHRIEYGELLGQCDEYPPAHSSSQENANAQPLSPMNRNQQTKKPESTLLASLRPPFPLPGQHAIQDKDEIDHLYAQTQLMDLQRRHTVPKAKTTAYVPLQPSDFPPLLPHNQQRREIHGMDDETDSPYYEPTSIIAGGLAPHSDQQSDSPPLPYSRRQRENHDMDETDSPYVYEPLSTTPRSLAAVSEEAPAPSHHAPPPPNRQRKEMDFDENDPTYYEPTSIIAGGLAPHSDQQSDSPPLPYSRRQRENHDMDETDSPYVYEPLSATPGRLASVSEEAQAPSHHAPPPPNRRRKEMDFDENDPTYFEPTLAISRGLALHRDQQPDFPSSPYSRQGKEVYKIEPVYYEIQSTTSRGSSDSEETQAPSHDAPPLPHQQRKKMNFHEDEPTYLNLLEDPSDPESGVVEPYYRKAFDKKAKGLAFMNPIYVDLPAEKYETQALELPPSSTQHAKVAQNKQQQEEIFDGLLESLSLSTSIHPQLPKIDVQVLKQNQNVSQTPLTSLGKPLPLNSPSDQSTLSSQRALYSTGSSGSHSGITSTYLSQSAINLNHNEDSDDSSSSQESFHSTNLNPYD